MVLEGMKIELKCRLSDSAGINRFDGVLGKGFHYFHKFDWDYNDFSVEIANVD